MSFEGEILTEVELTRPVTLIGRHPSCDICIDHPAVSARHMLFRVVNRTVYVEDLASTNGVKVNGHSTAHQVVHHLDLIEVGKHKLHFFDDTMLSGEVGNLESTVHTDFERTMLAQHVPAAAPAKQEAAGESGEDMTRTMAIPRAGLVETRQAPVSNGLTLGLRRLSGDRAGELVKLDQANTMLGEAGGDSALVVRRGESFMLARFGGALPRLNRQELGPGAHKLSARDVIEVGTAKFEVVQVKRENP